MIIEVWAHKPVSVHADGWELVRKVTISAPPQDEAAALVRGIREAKSWCEHELIGEPNTPLKVVLTKTVFRTHKDGPR